MITTVYQASTCAAPAAQAAEAPARVEMAEVEKIPASIGRELGDALLEAILNWKANQSQRGGEST